MANLLRKHMGGQVTMAGAIVVSLITMVGGVFSARLTANSTVNEKIAEVNTATAVVATKVDTNEKNTTDRLNRLEDKIDWLVRQQGGIPNQIAK